jgi:hypothetical protein
LALAGHLCLVTSDRAAGAQLQHFGYSPRDRLLECLEQVFHKPVFQDPNIPQIEPPSTCDRLSRDQLKETLRAQTIAVLEEPDAVLLLSSLILPPYAPTIGEASRVKWKRFKPVVSAKNASRESGFNERELSLAELAKIQKEVLEQARLVPVFQSDGEPLDIPTATFPIRLEVYIRHLQPGSPASLIVIVRGEENVAAGRLVYGEEGPNGTFKLLWDSPLFVARYLDLSFDDVDGDGFQEIILKSSFPAGMRDATALTVFNRRGNELTRQERCMQPVGYDFWPGHDTCPIVGDTVDFRYSNSPPFDIVASNVFYTRRMGIFRLKEGRYRQSSG